MPELPEVESVRLGLEQHVVGRTITDVSVLHPRPVRQHPGGPEAFATALAGRRVDAALRRGKYLWLALDEDALVAHLGMSGQFRIGVPGDPVHRHARVVLGLDDGTELTFVDQRMFGGLELREGMAADPVPHIAPDPFSTDFRLHDVARRLRAKRTTVKRALLDQTLVSGIGNIYADEALWRSRMHFETPTGVVGPRQATALLRNATAVMREALAVGGTSFDALYVRVNGESGYFDRALDAYGREGLPCRRCGTPMVRERFMNRSSTFCPRCQRLR
ncbi:bifunctional DNA-formamidopyrimidine glycosylase/DNA-(apurinic or apyrimidinic site) lyase [uncultured Tessaracoccus sp.]|uniref:bifunctional DNA-formamidopyrimidine glycosylase/DNA-(apurinic or apyrimidinic site) lyase n=1 Tax=uncultured Tessaracoccus sp. TaxID=905023 RepID=UPI0025FCCF81|nr:bifunctional DNA-formamidopyrimidine glycosylase/DNA-(apurinic or apyrimidinic site) lyase [uncultured Tessaracoccus sp.]